jgi:phage I-like protein
VDADAAHAEAGGQRVRLLLDIEPIAGLILVKLDQKDGEPVKEFRIFPYSDKIETDKGTFKFDEECASLIVADRAKRKTRLQIDYDHLAIKAEKPGDAKAAGWCDVEARADGLWAVNVEWTPAAFEMVKNKEYMSVSPFFGATKKDHRIVVLMNIAITNLPAMHESASLIAASRAFGYALEEVDEAACVIKKEGDKFVLYSHEGKRLGEHPTREAAEKQESAVNISKARDAGHHIPKPEAATNMKHKLSGYMTARMKKDGMSLKQLSEKSGLNEERMRKLADGEEPSPEEMGALGKAWGMSSDEVKETVDAHKASSMDDEDPEAEDDAEEEKAKKQVAASQRRLEQIRAKKASRKPAATTSDTEMLLVELTQSVDPEEQRKVLNGFVQMAKEFVPLKQAFDEQQKQRVEMRREQLVEKGKREGKLVPTLIAYWAKRDVGEFEEWLKAAPILPTASIELRQGTGVSASAAGVLDAEHLEVCRLSNTSPEEMAEFILADRAGKNRQAILDTYNYTPEQIAARAARK